MDELTVVRPAIRHRACWRWRNPIESAFRHVPATRYRLSGPRWKAAFNREYRRVPFSAWKQFGNDRVRNESWKPRDVLVDRNPRWAVVKVGAAARLRRIRADDATVSGTVRKTSLLVRSQDSRTADS